MTSKIVVNNIESDAGVSTVFFNSDIGGTGGTLNVDGNLNVDGVLSYEDVTNIDSVGLVTARNGLHVTSGNVAIGLNNPSAPLHLSGPAEIRLNNAIDAGNFARIRCFEVNGDNGAHLAFNTGAGEVVRFQNNGTIGINSTTPHRQLVVGDGGDISCLGTNGGIYFGTSTGGFRANGAIARAQQAGYHVSTSQVGDLVMAPEADKALIFSSGSTNTMYERLRVTTDGKVGINESSPDQALHVKGTNGDTVPARFESTGTISRIGFQASGTPTSYHVSCGAEANDFIVYTNNTEKLRIDSNGSALLTTTGQNTQYSYAMKLGQGAHLPNDSTSPHYGLWVRQLGPRYAQNYGIYSEVEDDSGFYGGADLDGLTSVRGIGVYGASTTSNQAYQKGIGLYGKATNETYNYNTVIGVRGRVETGTTTFTNNNGQKSYGGHFVATGKSDVIGVYADAYLDGSPGANQEAIPLLVSSNGSERLRVTSAGNIGVNKTPETDWASSYRAIEIGNSSVSAYQGSSYPSIELNMNCRGTQASYGAGWKYILGMRATQIHMPYSGETLFRRATSGSADGAISWNESMRISNDGSLYHRGNNSSTVNNTDGDSQASAGYPAGGATFNKNVSVNNGTSDFGQCMNMVSHTKSLNLDGSTNHNMITIYNREGCFAGHIYVGYSTGGDGAVAIYKFSAFYSTNSVTAELGPSSRSSDTVSADITSSGDSHTIRVNGNGYNGNVTVGVVFLSAGRTDSDHYGVRYW